MLTELLDLLGPELLLPGGRSERVADAPPAWHQLGRALGGALRDDALVAPIDGQPVRFVAQRETSKIQTTWFTIATVPAPASRGLELELVTAGGFRTDHPAVRTRDDAFDRVWAVRSNNGTLATAWLAAPLRGALAGTHGAAWIAGEQASFEQRGALDSEASLRELGRLALRLADGGRALAVRWTEAIRALDGVVTGPFAGTVRGDTGPVTVSSDVDRGTTRFLVTGGAGTDTLALLVGTPRGALAALRPLGPVDPVDPLRVDTDGDHDRANHRPLQAWASDEARGRERLHRGVLDRLAEVRPVRVVADADATSVQFVGLEPDLPRWRAALALLDELAGPPAGGPYR